MVVHLRHLSILSFITVVVVSLLVGGYFRIVTSQGIVQDSTEKHSVALAQFFIKNVWIHNHELMEKLSQQPVTVWKNNPKFKEFAAEVLRYTADMPVVSLKFYTAKGEIFLSSNNLDIQPKLYNSFSISALMERIFSSVEETNGLKLAESGMVHSRIIPSTLVRSPDGKLQHIASIQTFIPISSGASTADAGKVEAIVEVFSDITDTWNYLFYLQLVSTLGVIFIFSVLYSVLFYTSAKAQLLLHDQYQAALPQDNTIPTDFSSTSAHFLASLNHEIVTPLQSMTAVLALILHETAHSLKNTQYIKHLGQIHADGSDMLRKIQDMLDYARVESGELTLDNTSIDAAKLLKSMAHSMTADAEHAGLQLLSTIPDEECNIEADAKRLKQVIGHILFNAIRFTPKGGTITLSAWKENNGNILGIEVKDTGIGIPAEHITTLLFTSWQEGRRYGWNPDHTGIGLPLARKLITLINGSLELKSAPGLGTTVIIRLPLIR